MRMDRIGWHDMRDTTFRSIREKGADNWLLLLIKSPALIWIDGTANHTPAGTLILYSADNPRDYSADGEICVDDWMDVEPDTEERALLRELQIPLNTPITLKKSTSLSDLLRKICFEYYSVHQNRQEIVNLYFRILLYQLHDQITVTLSPERITQQLQWIQNCIFRKPFDKFHVERFAAELSMSPAEFETQYKQQLGFSFAEDITRSILRYGVKRMKDPDLTEEEAAQLCGYADTDLFLSMLAKYYPNDIHS